MKDLGWYREEPGITDSDMSHLILYLEKNYGLTSEKNVQHALDVVIANHHYHPVCDYLNALEWDGQERVLKELSENGGTMLQRELTGRLQLQRASVSEILGKLELRALIVREQSMSNRRSQDIRLTAEGIRAAEEIAGRQRNMMSSLRRWRKRSRKHSMSYSENSWKNGEEDKSNSESGFDNM